MGSSYSDLNLYFKNNYGNNQNSKNGQGKPYNITTKKETYKECVNYLKVTHTITFTHHEKGTHYNTILYDGNDDKHQGDYIFGYYYPRYNNEVVKEVHVYYSVLENDKPLVVSFVTHNNKTYNFSYPDLKYTGWVKAYYISSYISIRELSPDYLNKQFINVRSNKNIQFVHENKTENVSGYKQEIGQNENYIIIYIPKGSKGIIGINCLFNLDTDKPKCPETPKPNVSTTSDTNSTTNGNTNHIDPYYLDNIKNNFFDGIMVYFHKDGTALVLDFINNCNSNQYVRKDKNATYWANEKVEYTDDTKLNEKLDELKKQATSNDIVTYILDCFKKYNNVEVKQDENKKTYNKYTHTSKEIKQLNLVFNLYKITINSCKAETNINSLEVYYLKTNNKIDNSPFLIVLNENENKPDSSKSPPEPTPTQPETTLKTDPKKCYHFNNTDSFKDWQELKDCKSLEEKLDKIESSGSCAKELHLLRALAYAALTGKEEETKKLIGETQKIISLKPGPTVGDVLGYITAGIVVQSGIGAVLYGIYWYNTTIKLLT